MARNVTTNKRSDPPTGMSEQEIDQAIVELGEYVKEQKRLIDILLQGYGEPKKGGRRDRHYWKDKSTNENRGREALSDLLRSGRPLTQNLRNMLAALFDSREDQYHGIARRIKFEHRHRGNRRNRFNDTLVAQLIYDAVKSGAGVEAGVEGAIQKFGLKERMIRQIWGRYRPSLEYLNGALPRARSRRKSF
jgi:hypothetical protein